MGQFHIGAVLSLLIWLIMPNPFDQSHFAPIAQQLLDKEQMVNRFNPPPTPSTSFYPHPMTPDQAQLLGGLVDAGATYGMLKSGSAKEGDPLMKHLGNNPLATGLGVGGEALGQMLLAKLLRNKFPKLAPVVNAAEGIAGAGNMGTASEDLRVMSPNPPQNIENVYVDALSRAARKR